MAKTNTHSLDDTLALMRDLRARCEWDAAQTSESLRPYLIEEAHELDEAIRLGEDKLVREELGDVLLQVLFHSVLAEERGAFTFADVAEGLITKMKARHPHLYSQERRSRGQLKSGSEEHRRRTPRRTAGLHRAHRLQDRAAGGGFIGGCGGRCEGRGGLGEVRAELGIASAKAGDSSGLRRTRRARAELAISCSRS
jgi:uncharacterized protein YabN with tetrapyrrole methylase and pyrophosphatase domain